MSWLCERCYDHATTHVTAAWDGLETAVCDDCLAPPEDHPAWTAFLDPGLSPAQIALLQTARPPRPDDLRPAAPRFRLTRRVEAHGLLGRPTRSRWTTFGAPVQRRRAQEGGPMLTPAELEACTNAELALLLRAHVYNALPGGDPRLHLVDEVMLRLEAGEVVRPAHEEAP